MCCRGSSTDDAHEHREVAADAPRGEPRDLVVERTELETAMWIASEDRLERVDVWLEQIDEREVGAKSELQLDGPVHRGLRPRLAHSIAPRAFDVMLPFGGNDVLREHLHIDFGIEVWRRSRRANLDADVLAMRLRDDEAIERFVAARKPARVAEAAEHRAREVVDV